MLREGPLITAYHMGPLRIATKNLPGGEKQKSFRPSEISVSLLECSVRNRVDRQIHLALPSMLIPRGGTPYDPNVLKWMYAD